MTDQSNDRPQEEAAPPGFQLDPLEIRVLAVLAEKEAATPDNYPLSLNALTNGCNQLSSRDPVMAVDEAAVQDALERLLGQKLVNEVRQAGARALKYEHRMRLAWTLPQDKLAILATLMLRGPQTAGEVRARSGRLYEFASLAEVEAGLQFLIDKYPPLVARLARAPGSKEARHAHLLAGESALEAWQESAAPAAGRAVTGDRVGELERQVADLRLELQELARQFEQFRKQFD